MASTKSYVVKAPLVVAVDKEGHDRYLYQGASVPADLDADHRKMLVDEGLIEEAKEEEAATEQTEPTSSTGGRSRSGSSGS